MSTGTFIFLLLLGVAGVITLAALIWRSLIRRTSEQLYPDHDCRIEGNTVVGEVRWGLYTNDDTRPKTSAPVVGAPVGPSPVSRARGSDFDY